MKAVDKRYQRLVSVHDLKPGMYIHELDRPWVETRFMFQGFVLTDPADIDELRRTCQHVVIDIERGIEAEQYLDTPIRGHQPDALNLILSNRPAQNRYRDSVTIEEEMEPAKEIYDSLRTEVSTIMEDVRMGKQIKTTMVKEAVGGMIDSIVRNPDAFLWLSKMKTKDAYTYVHSIDACTLAIAFGRHLGLEKHELEHLAIGTLLFDVGKMQLPEELLAKPGKLTADEFALMQKHVEYSTKVMSGIKGMHNTSLEVAQTHHERHNGKGYPHGITGTNIPIFGRIGALVDCYDAIISDRAYSAAMSQHEAVLTLYQWRDVDFQTELIEQFIQCLGVYPTGSLVELSTGEIGIVISQNRIRRLRPKVMVVLDARHQPLSFSPIIDLARETEDRHGNPLAITQPLDPDAYDIDLRDYYL